MRQAALTLILLAACSFTIGCSNPDLYARHNLSQARTVVEASINDIGGLQNWQHVAAIHATAVVAFYQDNGQADIDRLSVVMNFQKGTICVTGQSSQGIWTGTVDQAGSCQVQGTTRSAAEICRELRMLLHRSAGQLNLVSGRERAQTFSTAAKIEGIDVVRTGAVDNHGQPLAYYFDTTTCMLRFITAGADQPGKDGNIAIYPPRESYYTLPCGVLFPKSFRVMKIGQNVLLSDKPVMEVEFSNVTVEMAHPMSPSFR